DVSSQFLSGLLMAAVGTRYDWKPRRIRIDGPLVSVPYVDMTLAMMNEWGIDAGWDDERTISVNPHWQGHPNGYDIEPDASAASYFWAAAAITGGRVTVAGLNRKSLQGDVRFVDVLAEMGCRVEACDAGI